MNNETIETVYEITAQELDEKCRELKDLYTEKGKIADVLKEVNKKIASREFYLAEVFQVLGKTENSGDWGKVILKRMQKFTVADLDPLKKYMQDKGVWDDMARVHQGTLQAWLKEEVANKRKGEQKDAHWLPDGVVEEEVLRCSIRKNK